MSTDIHELGAKPDKAAWYLVVVVVLAQLLSYIDRGVLSLFARPIQAAFELTDSQLGYLFGLGFIVPLAVCSLVVGWGVDRYNRVAIILLGVLLWSAMTILCGLAGSYGVLLAARGGIGIGEATLTPAAYALIADRFAPERRGRAVGAVAASVSVGAGSALIVGGVMLSALGPANRVLPYVGTTQPYQLIFVMLGLLGLPVAVMVLTLKDSRGITVVDGRRPPALREVLAYVKRNAFTFSAIFSAGAVNVAVGTGVMSWAPSLLLRRFEITSSIVGYIIGVSTLVGGLVGPPLAMELSDRRLAKHKTAGRLQGIPYFFLGLLVGAVTLGLSTSLWVCVIGIILVAATLGAINALSYAAIQDLSPSRVRGRMIAMLQFVTLAVGYGVGPSLIAAVTDHVFHDKQKINLSLIIVSVPLVIAAISLVVGARRSYQATHEFAKAEELPGSSVHSS